MRTLMGVFAALLTAAMIGLGVASAEHDGQHYSCPVPTTETHAELADWTLDCIGSPESVAAFVAANADTRAYADGTYEVLNGERKGDRYRYGDNGAREWIEVSSD